MLRPELGLKVSPDNSTKFGALLFSSFLRTMIMQEQGKDFGTIEGVAVYSLRHSSGTVGKELP